MYITESFVSELSLHRKLTFNGTDFADISIPFSLELPKRATVSENLCTDRDTFLAPF